MTIIERVAQEHGISPDECRAAIQEVISTAWATTDPTVKQRQIRLVGEGTPTPEEFISLISRMVDIDRYNYL
jgi:hypothetical protein